METNLIKIARRISTPISLASAIIMVLYLLYRIVLGLDIFTHLEETNTFLLLNSIVDKVFILAIVGLVLGIVSYLIHHYFLPKKQDLPIPQPFLRSLPKGYRRFSVYVIYNDKINKIPQVEMPESTQWSTVSNGCCVAAGAPQNPQKYKILDVKKGVWLPTPSTLAELKSDSIALVSVDFANLYNNDANTIEGILLVGG